MIGVRDWDARLARGSSKSLPRAPLHTSPISAEMLALHRSRFFCLWKTSRHKAELRGRKKTYTQTQTPEYQNWLLRVSSVIPRIPIALECRWVVVARQFVAARPSSNERRLVLRHSELVPEHNKQAIIAYEKDRKMDSVSQTHILGATHAMP